MELYESAERLAHLIEEKLGVRGHTLEAKLARVGRSLPKHIHGDVVLVMNALAVEGHPKLSRLQDPEQVRRAFSNAERYLVNLDAGARQRGAFLDWLARLVFNLLLLGGLLVLILRWRALL